jgi:alpha-mannosidase
MIDTDATVTLENAFVRLQVSRPSGRIHVFDKGAGRTIIEQSELIAEESAPGSWFDYHRTGRALPNVVDKIEVVENGAIRARLVIEGHIGQIPTRQNWFLYHDLAVVDILDELVWSHHPTPIMVQRTLPTDMKDPLVTYGVPFGANGWEEQQPKIGPHLGDEVSQEMYERIREVQHWIDFSTADHGVTVASDRRCIERAGGELRINLIYAGGDFAFFERHAHNTNRFSARTRLCAHPGDWRTGRSYRAGFSLLLPLVALSVADPLSSKSLAPVASLCQIPQDNIILTMIKCSEDGSATTLRGFEAEGRTTVASPSLLGSENRISETNLYEENPTSVNAVSWRPYEIKTLRIE